MAKGKDIDDIPSSTRDKRPRVNELVDMVQLNTKWHRLRLVGAAFSYGTHWVETKKRDGSVTKFPTPCLAYDSETEERDSSRHCPWCKCTSKKVQFRRDVFMNAISRAEMKKAPDEPPKPTRSEAKSGFKEKDSDTFTPYRVVSLPPSMLGKIKELKQLNTHEDPETGDTVSYSVSHPKYGRDISIMYDKDKAGTDKYAVQMGDPSPLKKAEKAYLQWDLSNLVENPSEEEAEKEFKSWAQRNLDGSEGDDDDEDRPKSKKKRASVDDDDDDDITPVKKSKAKKAVDDDDDDFDEPKAKAKRKTKPDDDDDDDDDIDIAPKSKSKKAKPVEEDEDEDDDEDDPPPKSKAKKAKPVEDDEDDDDEDDEDDPPVKKGKKASAKKAKKVSDEDDEDEDEDDEPPKKSKKRVVDDDDDEPPKKSKKAKKPADDDDDDDDDL